MMLGYDMYDMVYNSCGQGIHENVPTLGMSLSSKLQCFFAGTEPV